MKKNITDNNNAIIVDNVYKKFKLVYDKPFTLKERLVFWKNTKVGYHEVLKNINLKLESGKIYGFVGRNGSGKSILLKTICGFLKPNHGNVIINGVDIYKNGVFPKNTRALIDIPNYIPDLTGFENLSLLASIENIIGKEEIEQTLKLVNLYEEKDKKFKKY